MRERDMGVTARGEQVDQRQSKLLLRTMRLIMCLGGGGEGSMKEISVATDGGWDSARNVGWKDVKGGVERRIWWTREGRCHLHRAAGR